MSRRSARLSKKQNDLFKDLLFTLTPGVANSSNTESKITKQGGKVQRIYTKKVNYVIALKKELAESKLHSKIKNGLENTECKVVSEDFIDDCIKESKIVDVENYLLKPLSDEDRKTQKIDSPAKKVTKKNNKKEQEKEENEEDDSNEEKKVTKKKAKQEKEDDDNSEKKKKVTKKNPRKGKDKDNDDGENKKKTTGKRKRTTKKEKEEKEDKDDAMDVDEKEEDENEEEEEEKEIIVKEIRKGRTVVDSVVPNSQDYHVYEDGDEIYDATLNQTNIANNNNKFYNLQILKKDNNSSGYFFWTRWGRVGEKGQNKLLVCNNKEMAISCFKTKFRDKTGNNWEDRKNFVKKNKKYFLIERDYGVTEEEEEENIKKKAKKEEKINIPDSKLNERVQNLIKLIFDISLMEQEMAEIGYNAKKMPLGKLTKDHIKKSFDVLKKLDDELSKEQPKRALLSDLTSEFYTIIPHDFGRSRPPVIDNKVLLKKKIEMVESLADIHIATTLLKNQNVEITENPIDTNYRSLHCNLSPLDHESEEFDMINTYVKNTHAKTHSWYELEIDDVYIVDREGEKERFLGDKYPDKKRKLLWHGSRLTNFVGILSQGLRIAPPEAPVTGYMFGKGVYFADMVSKSANYCCASNNLGLMLLCEVVTGEENNLFSANYNAGELVKKNKKDSTKGCGKTAPDPTKSMYTKDGVEVPYGPAIDVKIDDSSLLYNEYIVYDVAQIKMRYLIKMKFKKPSNNKN